ncbi:MAG: FG-GAP repeat protein, partial [Solirubrobacteraceae bacterium]
MAHGTAVTVGTMRASTGGRGRRELLLALAALVAGALVAVILSVPGAGTAGAGAGAGGAAPARDGLAALLRLPAAAQGPISAALGRDLPDYRISGVVVANPAQRLSARFAPDGARITAGRDRFTIGLRAAGRGSQLSGAEAVSPSVRAGRIVYDRPGLTEVWRNGPLGLEQSFVLSRRPGGTGQLTLAVAVPAGSRMDGAAVLLPGRLRYSGLRAVDARGRVLPSSMHLSQDRTLLRVDDSGAAYPITVDPLLQQAQLTEATGTTSANQTGDQVGYSVAISGSTIVVGALHATVDGYASAGAAFVFQEGSGGWANTTQTATLTASDPATFALFGYSVAISGNTIVVGAPTFSWGDGGGNPSVPTSEAYIYEMPAGGWTSATETTELTPPGEEPGFGYPDPAFGYSVAIDGSTVVVGAPYQALDYPGAVYVYTLSSTGAVTGTPATLTDGPVGTSGAKFGLSVAISGSTIVVGAPAQQARFPGAAYIYAMPAGGWATTSTPSTALVPSDLGANDSFGYSVAADGTTVVVAAPWHSGSNPAIVQEGALYVFEEPSTGWPTTMTQNSELTASDALGDTTLGVDGVAISGSTIIGATNEGSTSTEYGAGYVFTEPAGGWPATMTQTQKLLLTPGGGAFASAVGLSGSTAVLGAPTAAADGAAYVFGPGTTTTTTSLTSSANPSIPGQQVTYTAMVSPVPDGGTVAFADNGVTI